METTRRGSTFIVEHHDPPARFTFRDVRVDRDPSADVTIAAGERHLFRTTSTLSLTGRDRLARTAAEMAGADFQAWRSATFSAVEAAMAAVEELTAGVDLRYTKAGVGAPRWVAAPVLTRGATLLVAPGESGKSTIGRALALSVASGVEIIPGIVPVKPGPVFLVISEDADEAYHTDEMEAIARGAGIDRADLPHLVNWQSKKAGSSLRHVARSLAERAADAELVVVDAMQGWLGSSGESGVRDQAQLFWDAIDEIGVPTLVIAHPNQEQSRGWSTSDGRAAGAEVHRDRARIAWRLDFEDEPAVIGTTYRRYTLRCTKHNRGPRSGPVAFGLTRTFVASGDSGTATFLPADAIEREPRSPRESAEAAATRAAVEAGFTTPKPLADHLGITEVAAAKRLARYRASLRGGVAA